MKEKSLIINFWYIISLFTNLRPVLVGCEGKSLLLFLMLLLLLLSIVIYLPDVLFLPISGLIGANLKTRMDKSICPWWDGPCLFEALDSIEVPLRDPNGPFRYGVSEL